MGWRFFKGIPESLRALEVGDVRWQPVPVTDGPRIKGERTCMCRLWPVPSLRIRLDPLVRWSFSCTEYGLMSVDVMLDLE